MVVDSRRDYYVEAEHQDTVADPSDMVESAPETSQTRVVALSSIIWTKEDEDSMTFESLFTLLRIELNNAAHGRGMIHSKFSNTLELPNGQLANIELTLRGRSISMKVPSVIGSPKVVTEPLEEKRKIQRRTK